MDAQTKKEKIQRVVLKIIVKSRKIVGQAPTLIGAYMPLYVTAQKKKKKPIYD